MCANREHPTLRGGSLIRIFRLSLIPDNFRAGGIPPMPYPKTGIFQGHDVF